MRSLVTVAQPTWVDLCVSLWDGAYWPGPGVVSPSPPIAAPNAVRPPNENLGLLGWRESASGAATATWPGPGTSDLEPGGSRALLGKPKRGECLRTAALRAEVRETRGEGEAMKRTLQGPPSTRQAPECQIRRSQASCGPPSRASHSKASQTRAGGRCCPPHCTRSVISTAARFRGGRRRLRHSRVRSRAWRLCMLLLC